MEDIKVKKYIRTTDGIIGQIVNINDFREPTQKYAIDIPNAKDVIFCGENYIKKCSEILIDLIEIGDFVNGERIVDKTGDYIKTENSIHNIFYLSKNIETILTHEQYERNCYKVGEN